MKEIRKGVQLKGGMGKLISIVRGSREMKGFRNDSLSIFGEFIWKEIRKGVQLNRGMGKLISIVRGSREMKGFRNDSLSIFGVFI